MNFELYKKLIEQTKKSILINILYFQGEPFLNPEIFKMIEYSNLNKIYSIISTNGHFLSSGNIKKIIDSKLNKLIISIDGATQDIYSSYRIGGNLDKVLEGIEALQNYKKETKSKHPKVYLQFLVTSKNEHQINDIKNIGKKYNVDKVVFKTIQVYDYENGNVLIPSNKKYSRYILNKCNKYELKNELLNHCWRIWSSCVVTWDGNVVPCCFDKDAKYIMGNINENTLEEIWNGERFNDFRKAILKNRKSIDICNNCTEGTKVWI